MNASLRPMTLGEILDRTFHIYRSRFRFFLAIGALPALAALAIFALGLVLDSLLSQTTLAASTKRAVEDFGSGIPVDSWQSLFRFAAWPMFIYAASEELFDQNSPFRNTLVRCWERRRSWLAGSIVLWSMWNGIPALMYRVPILERARLNAALTLRSLDSIFLWPRSLFFLYAGSLLALALSVTLWFCVPVWTLESLPLRSVLSRGRLLVKLARRRIVIAWILLSTLGWVLTWSVSFLVIMLWQWLTPLHRADLNFSTLRAFLVIPGYAVPILLTPLFPIALTLIYYDQRMRREGFDIEMMMNTAGMTAPLSAESEIVPIVAAEPGEPSA